MNSAFKALVCAVLLSTTGPSLAYEVDTHEKLSGASLDASILKTHPQLLVDLGLKPLAELQTFPNSQGDPRTVVQLIQEGSRFEDNNIRPLFHFFDPLNDGGLLFFTSPTWALEDKGKIHLLQNYSLSDARNAFYEALIATSEDLRKTKFGKTFESLGHVIHHIQDMAQPQHVRLDAHLNLDLTDEELPFENRSRYEKYTKDNPDKLTLLFGLYPPINSKDDINFLTTPRSFWHTQTQNPAAGLGIAEFTNVNFVSAGTNFLGAFQGGGLTALPNERYPLPVPNPATPRFELAEPLLQAAGKNIQDYPECAPPNNPCVMAFFSTNVVDNYRPAFNKENRYASTASIFDQDLELHGKVVPYPVLNNCTNPSDPTTCQKIYTGQIFALNRFNFDAAHEFLIPRAVAYSAGLIDYFFRGRLEAQDVNYTDQGIELRVHNAIDSRATPAWKDEILKSGGSLVLAYEYKPASLTGNHAPVFGVSAPVMLVEDIRPGNTSFMMYSFTIPEIPENANDVKYRLVYRGRLGQEANGVAVGTVEPISGFLVTPSSTPPDGISGRRHVYRAWGKWRLGQHRGLLAGNIDWKGDYFNGRPTVTLTWQGPPARYFPLIRGYPFTEEIYRNGQVYAVAPLPVLGAAISRDNEGKRWLIAIGSDGMTDFVYRRPNKRSTSQAMYDPQTNPDGWEIIGSFTGGQGYREANRPWFFNASGTQAVTLREVELEQDPILLSGSIKTVILELQMSNVTDAMITTRDNEAGWNRIRTATYNSTDSSAASTLTADGSGRYVVGVDYRENVLVTCEMRLEESESSNASWTAGTSSITYKGQTHGRYRQILECGRTAQDLWDEQFDGQLAVTATPGLVGAREKTYRLKYVSIEYADARYGLIVAGEKELSSQNSCLDAGGQSESIYKETDLIAYGNHRLSTFVFEYPNSQSGYCDLPYNWVSGFNYGTIEERVYPTVYAGLSLTDGDWLIDRSETLLTSQTRGANHYDSNTGRVGTGEFYNQLDGAQLDTLLGGVASPTSYFPMWVLH